NPASPKSYSCDIGSAPRSSGIVSPLGISVLAIYASMFLFRKGQFLTTHPMIVLKHPFNTISQPHSDSVENNCVLRRSKLQKKSVSPQWDYLIGKRDVAKSKLRI